MNGQNILVTGGLGFIGSRVVNNLTEKGANVLVVDDCPALLANAPLHGERVLAEDFASQALKHALRDTPFDAVIHMAAYTSVPESVMQPMMYYDNNVVKTLKLIEWVQRFEIPRFIFISTGAAYGEQSTITPIKEDQKLNPRSPYAHSKAIIEQALADIAAVNPSLHYAVLRYANVSGAAPDGSQGPVRPNLIAKVLATQIAHHALTFNLFGTDYDTPDGTAVRDYIHVDDVAEATTCALAYLAENNDNPTINISGGTALSNLEVIAAAERVIAQKISVIDAPRRAGDVPISLLDNTRMIRKLQPKLQYQQDIEAMLAHTITWAQKHS